MKTYRELRNRMKQINLDRESMIIAFREVFYNGYWDCSECTKYIYEEMHPFALFMFNGKTYHVEQMAVR